ncbi:MAG: hypothetical protein VB079_03475 [Petrimonas sp.]|jgi:hypothetical protein|uniref:hypothetical protein n=1 Tax=Proteiniphilum sp. TaxID=1926877 RepID=UPI002B1FDE25|nr:hypothetical protein [Proteiniphilum sp.]MEA4995534.1 hypothetical protein [Petrimonas sp.]MEA5064272.1 hypothetical protein [Petrimonas sp.]HMM17728.1 hypothetical protein [Petrimonas sp.]
MKKYTSRFFLLSLFVLNGILPFTTHLILAQDLLITVRQDSMNCKVGKLTGDFYPIEFKWDDTLMSGMIHKDSVLFFRKNIFRSMDDNRLRPWYPIVSLGLNVGGGRQFGQLRVGLTEDFKPREGTSSDRNIFYAGADLSVYLSKRVGYGFKSHYRSMLSGDIRQYYIGPIISFRFWDNKRKNHWLVYCSAGYGRMKHNNAMIKIGTKDPELINLTANTFASDFTVGYNLKVTPNLSTQFKLSLTIAYPDYVRIFDYTRINPGGTNPAPDISGYCQNMNGVNLSVGVGFN